MMNQDGVRVETTGGVLRGIRVDGVRTWRGIPFGAAERWKAPRPVRWQGE